MIELTEGSDYWTPEILAQALLGIWFAASHQPWMNLDFVLLELCGRPEWVEALRNEILQQGDLNYERLEQLPLLDSFIKETMRLNPLDTRMFCLPVDLSPMLIRLLQVAIRRKALKPYTFSDGAPFVPAGSTVCVSSYDLMHDERTYPEPNIFNGSRFVSEKPEYKQKRLMDVSEKFPVWGYGSLAWYDDCRFSEADIMLIRCIAPGGSMHL